MSNPEKKFAVFDIDGTVIRDSLFLQVVDELIARDHLPVESRAALDHKWEAYRQRQHAGAFKEYEQAVVDTLFGHLSKLTEAEYRQAVDVVIKTAKGATYVYTRDLLHKLKEQGYFLVALSASEQYAVEEFAKPYGFDLVVAEQYATEQGVFTGEVAYVSGRKDVFLKQIVAEHDLSLEGSIGIGDSKSDIDMLELVEHPIAFNPEKELFAAAKQNGWKIVVERKNVAYELEPNQGSYTLAETA